MKQKEELILKRVLSDMRIQLLDKSPIAYDHVFIWHERLLSLVVKNPLIIAFDDYGNRV